MEHSPDFKEFMDNNPEIVKHVNVLLKQNKTVGRHAGGIIIADKILEKMPILRVRGELQTPWVEGLHHKHLDPQIRPGKVVTGLIAVIFLFQLFMGYLVIRYVVL